ncbi:MAG TPA: PASTA domain-containing protein [Terriglobia bacterium]|nr:PASTA domain-containing protein [Terriglobia bacterium]
MIRKRLETPYVGLVPYTEEDSRFFFGREKEEQVIVSNLFASKLTILYGASGVGKSSILRAGVVRELNDRTAKAISEEGAPDLAAVYFSDWKANALIGLKLALNSALAACGVRPTADPHQSLAAIIRDAAQQFDGCIMIIFDQFEEYFLYHTGETGPGSLAYEFAEAANDSRLPVSFLVSLRDDALSKLDRFKALIPNLFSNYLRVQPLTRQQAQRAIVLPVEAYNRLPEEERLYGRTICIEPDFVEEILDEVRQDRVLIGEVGRGVVSATASTGIETPYLQLVLTKVWNEELGSGSCRLRAATLERLGGAEEIVGKHLEGVLELLTESEKEICSRMFQFLVTPGGTKIAHTSSDLADFAKVPQELLEPILGKLSGSETRILSTVSSMAAEGPMRYEIYHDSLAHAILDWRKSYVARKEREEQERIRAAEAERQNRELEQARALATAQRERAEAQVRSTKRLQWMLGTLALFLLFVVLAASYAWNQRRIAMENEQLAKANEQRAQQNALEAQEAQAEAARAGEALAKSFGAKEEAERWSRLAVEAQAQVRNLEAKGVYESDKVALVQRAKRKLDEELAQARAENAQLKRALDQALPKGINKAIVPDFVGMTVVQTTAALADSDNFKTGRITERRSDQHPGVVLQQTPRPGARINEGSPIHLLVSAPARPDASVRLLLKVLSFYVLNDSAPGAASWKFSIFAGPTTDATRPIITIPKDSYDNDSPQPKVIRGQARIPTHEEETVRFTVRGTNDAGVVAEGQFSVFVKPLAKWSAPEIVRVPIVSWGNSSKGSFVGIFEVVAQP